MVNLRSSVAGAFISILICSCCLTAVMVVWTAVTLLKLSTPGVLGLGKFSESSSIEIYSSSGNLMYKKNYFYGGRLSSDDDISIPAYIIEIVRKDAKFKNYSIPYRFFLKIEGVEPKSLAGFLNDYYSERLVGLTGVEGLKKDLLKIYTTQRLKGKYSDKELYSIYLDSVYFSQNVQGIKGAARAYFDKEYSDLSPLELSYLMALVLGEKEYAGKSALNYLRSLYEGKYIRPEVYRQELSKRLIFQGQAVIDTEPSISRYIISNLNKNYPGVTPGEKTIIINTHCNEKALDSIREVLKRVFDANPSIQAGFVLVNTDTGGIEAAVGSRVKTAVNNRALYLRRQMGSVFKPVVYATAFDNGVSPSKIVEDKRFNFIQGGVEYSPKNFRDKYFGKIPLRLGLVHSLNNTTVALALDTGLDNIVDTSYKMGYSGEMKPYPSLALGTFSATPANVARMYTALANSGTDKGISFIQKLTVNGEEISPFPYEPVQALSPASAYQTLYIMQAVAVEGTARKAGLATGTAVKTGTTDNNRDYWTAAVMPPYVAVLWVGNDDNSPVDTKASAGSFAAPLIANFQKEFFGEYAFFEIAPPEEVIYKKVSLKTGMETAKDEGSYIEAFNKRLIE